MPKYKKLPPPEVLKVHGFESLKLGWYKTREPDAEVTPEDTLLHVSHENFKRKLSWFKNGKLHREDGPAESIANISEKWFFNGLLHRDDGPAETGDGAKWFHHGELHRVGGPALITDHKMVWYLHGDIHREDGPAVEFKDGSYFAWYKHGFLHREGGPAVHNPLSKKGLAWYIDGKRIEIETQEECDVILKIRRNGV